QTIYEQTAVVPDPRNPAAASVDDTITVDGDKDVVAPVRARPARASRLVFAVPGTETIAFSTAGLLAAIQRLPMVLHPLAEEPGEALVTASPDGLTGPRLHLPGGLVAVVTAQGLVVNELSSDAVGPADRTAGGLSVLARDLRRARLALAGRTGRVAPGIAAARLHDGHHG